MERIFPFLNWLREYNKTILASDLVAAIVVTIMLIPQSLAYALLAGLPPRMGLYASILPLIAYALFGTSRALAVGPVAVISLMTAAAAGKIAEAGSTDYITAAILLALMSGLFLTMMGILRLGFLANFLSHPVISGFISASAILIAASQIKHLLAIDAQGHNLLEIAGSLISNIANLNSATTIIGFSSLLFLFWVRSGFKPLLLGLGLKEASATLIARTGPIFAVIGGISAVAMFNLEAANVPIVGTIPTGLPILQLPAMDRGMIETLAMSALLISVVGFVESVSVAQTLAAKRRQRVDPNQELIGLGAANLAAGVSNAYPVTGGFARSAVNFDAGAQTPAAGAFAAIGIAGAALFLTPLLYFLPNAVLAATIIVAIIPLINIGMITSTWHYSKNDFAAILVTILVTLTLGVELGICSGVLLSILLHLYRTSRPHFAIVGQVPGTQHFRNIKRHDVITSACTLTVRIDESLYFANVRFLEDTVYELVSNHPDLKHVVLMCPAVNHIDTSGLEGLEAINARLHDAGVKLHLSEVKGPVMDRLQGTHFLTTLTGKIFLHQYEAMCELDADCARMAFPGPIQNDHETNGQVISEHASQIR